VTLLFALSMLVTVSLVIHLLAGAMSAQRRVVRDRLIEVRAMGHDPTGPAAQGRRMFRSEQVMRLLEAIGTRLTRRGGRAGTGDAEMLVHAGYRIAGALAIYWGTRLLLGTGAGMLAAVVLPTLNLPLGVVMFGAVYFGSIAYFVPMLQVRRKRRHRQKELQLALPDALDLLVVCVEAGLGLNQALIRVADEMRHSSMLMSEELLQTNAEIRVGTPREQALRALADRTGLDDISSLVTMLIQTDRFGTSIATSLRVHSDVLRQKRRQRAEEAAAKTAIKMVFPLVFCIFPAMFVVILGPGMIRIFRALSALQ